MTLDPSHLIIITGPSGVGKDSILEALRSRGLPLSFVITTTSRPRRSVDRHIYHFVDAPSFERMIGEGAFVEWAKVYDHYYGTRYAALDEADVHGGVVILENDIQGARTIKKCFPDATLIFIAPKNLDELHRRLVSRGQNTPEEIERRLRTGEHELAQQNIADHVVINEHNQLSRAVGKIESIIREKIKGFGA